MYGMGTKTCFIGVSVLYNTMKHVVEGWYAEHVLSLVRDPAKRLALQNEVATFGHFTGKEIWPMYDGRRMEEEYEKAGLIRDHIRTDNQVPAIAKELRKSRPFKNFIRQR